MDSCASSCFFDGWAVSACRRAAWVWSASCFRTQRSLLCTAQGIVVVVVDSHSASWQLCVCGMWVLRKASSDSFWLTLNHVIRLYCVFVLVHFDCGVVPKTVTHQRKLVAPSTRRCKCTHAEPCLALWAVCESAQYAQALCVGVCKAV